MAKEKDNKTAKTLTSCQTISIGEFFTQKICSGKIIIPPNQRPYAWDDDNITDFKNDLENARLAAKDGNGHYFNMITFVRDKANILIHDGQQRISTSFFSLIYLMQSYKRSVKTQTTQIEDIPLMKEFEASIRIKVDGREDRKFEMFSYNDQLLEKIYECIDEGNQESSFREQLEKKLKEDNLDKFTSNKKILKIFEILDDYCKKTLEGNPQSYVEAFTILYNNFEIVTAAIVNPDQAYKIFELVNNRGQKLSDIDLVKNKMYQLANESSNKVENIAFVENKIREIILEFGDDFEKVLTMEWLVYKNKSGKTNFGKPAKIFDSFSNGVNKYNKVEEFLQGIYDKREKIKVFSDFLKLSASDILCEDSEKSPVVKEMEKKILDNNLCEMVLIKTLLNGLNMDYADYFLYYLFIEFQTMGKLHTNDLVCEYKKILSFYFVRSIANDRMNLDKLNLQIGYRLSETFGQAQNKEINLNKLFTKFLAEEKNDNDSKYLEQITSIGRIISAEEVETKSNKLKTLFYFGNWYDNPKDYFVQSGDDFTLVEEEHVVPKAALKAGDKYDKYNVSNADSLYRGRIEWLGNKLLLSKTENITVGDKLAEKIHYYAQSENWAVKKYYYYLISEFLDYEVSETNIITHEKDYYRDNVIQKVNTLKSKEIEEKFLNIERNWRTFIGKYIQENDCLGINELVNQAKENK